MPSPFPGMDPWLERPMLFPSVHNGMIYLIQTALNRGLPAGYAATHALRVWVDPEQRREPDVSVFGPHRPPADDGDGPVATALAGAGLLAVADPVPEVHEEPYLEVRTVDDDRLVTAVEVLSRANKTPGDTGREDYRRKQQEYRLAGVSLVEVDLLRGGTHTTAVSPGRARAVAGPFDYHVCVTAAGVYGKSFVAPIRLADRLPTVPVPLDPGVPPVPVDLQAAFDRVYDEGAYSRLARYGRHQPDPPLSPEQAEWAAGVLRDRGVVP